MAITAAAARNGHQDGASPFAVEAPQISAREPLYSQKEVQPNHAGMVSVCAGMMFHLVLGTLYCWGNFQSYAPKSMQNYDGTFDPENSNTVDIVQILPLTLAVHNVMMPIGAMINDRLGPFPTLVMSAAFVCSGPFFASFASSLGELSVLYAGLLGTGTGLGFVAPIITGFKHFPNSKGVISGLIAGAFGLGGFIFNPVGSFIFNPNGLSLGKDEKLLPCSVTDNFGPSLRKMASIYFLVALAAVPLIRLPKQQEASGGSSVGQQAMSVRDVLRTPAFWIMWLTTALASQGALYIGSTYKAIAMGLDNPALHDDAYLAWVAALGSLSNGLFRPMWGLLYDRIGYRLGVSTAAFTHVVLLRSFPMLTSDPHLYMGGVVLSFAAFAGYAALLPVESFRLFGNGVVMGLLGLSFAFAGIFGTTITNKVANILTDEGDSTVDTAFGYLSIMSFVAFLLVQCHGRSWTMPAHAK